MTDSLTAEKVYSLIITEDIPRAAALNIIRSYGNRKVIEALEEARKAAAPEAAQSILDVEIEARLTNCLRMPDEFTGAAIAAQSSMRNE